MSTPKEEKTPSRIITKDIMVNASMIETSRIGCDYPTVDAYHNAIISNGKIVNFVGAGYGFVSTQEFFGGFEKMLDAEHIKYTTKYRNVNDSQFTADYTLDGELFVSEKATKYTKDKIQPKLRLTHSYDGKVPLAGYFGFFRQVCGNGLHLMVDELAFKQRRTKSMVEMVFPSMAEMIESYKTNDMVKLHRTFEVMAETQVNEKNLKDIVKELAEKTKLFKFEKSDKNPEPSLQAQTVLDTIARESDLLKIVPNTWLVYNAFNEWIYNDDRNGKNDADRRKLDLSIFDAVNKTLVLN